MPLSPALMGTVGTLDLDKAPGAGAFIEAPHQVNNSKIDAIVVRPSTDFDGSDLTGLNKQYAFTLLANPDGTNPLDGLTSEAILAFPGIVTEELALTASDAGTTASVSWNVISFPAVQVCGVIYEG